MRSLADQISTSLRDLANLLHLHGVDRYLSMKAAVAYSGLSRRTLHRHLHDRNKPLPAFKVGRKWVIKRSEFDRWIEEHRHRPPLFVRREVDLDEIIRRVVGDRPARARRQNQKEGYSTSRPAGARKEG